LAVKKGDRVMAIMEMTPEKVKIFGEGEYIGDEVPKGAAGFMGDMLEEAGIPNPAILLDDGRKIYGCECWWGAVESAKQQIGERKIIRVDIEKYRREASDNSNDA